MYKRLLEGWRAAAHIGEAVQKDFGESRMEIFSERIEGSDTLVCDSSELAGKLVRFCKNFPMAELFYHPDSAYGFVAQVRCCCSHETIRGCCRANGCSRSRILVLLQPEYDPDPEIRKNKIREEADRNLASTGSCCSGEASC